VRAPLTPLHINLKFIPCWSLCCDTVFFSTPLMMAFGRGNYFFFNWSAFGIFGRFTKL
jgi:hypothetical protein